jgi:MerR family transcriptional regulator, redox-sensitive transcriptional activator SoxR
VAIDDGLLEQDPCVEERQPHSESDNPGRSVFVRIHAGQDATSSRLEVKKVRAMSTIGMVAARTGLRASAIRYYEAQGLLPAAAREGGRRVYDTSVFPRIAVIKLAKAAGFNLTEIRSVLAAVHKSPPAAAWRIFAEEKQAEIAQELEMLLLRKRVVNALGRCACASLEDCGQTFADALAKYRTPTRSARRVETRRINSAISVQRVPAIASPTGVPPR